jgi:hypothetical protein
VSTAAAQAAAFYREVAHLDWVARATATVLRLHFYWHPVQGLLAIDGAWDDALMDGLFGFHYDRN